MSKIEDVSVACTSCSRHHLTTIAALLNEAARMAKNRDMCDSEIQDRISMVEQEADAMERIDLSSEKISALPPKAKEVTRKMLNDVRTKIRHKLDMGIRWGQGSIDDLENIAKDATIINNTYLQDITPYHLEKLEKNITGTMGQTSVSDNTWIWWIVGGALAGFMGWLVFRKKEEEVV